MVETFDCTNINLKKNDKGSQVTLLQTHLKTLGYYTQDGGVELKVDGDFGKYTEAAVKAFQKATGHTDDGVFGPKTCPDLNKKILEKNGINTTTAAAAANNNKNNTTKAAPKIIIDSKKSPYKANESNLHIEGLHFIVSKITHNTAFHSGNWKTIELMDNTNYVYQGRPTPKKYTVEIYMTIEKYNKCKSELEKLGLIKCKVTSDILDDGDYFLSLTLSNESRTEHKLTIELTENMGG